MWALNYPPTYDAFVFCFFGFFLVTYLYPWIGGVCFISILFISRSPMDTPMSALKEAYHPLILDYPGQLALDLIM